MLFYVWLPYTAIGQLNLTLEDHFGRIKSFKYLLYLDPDQLS